MIEEKRKYVRLSKEIDFTYKIKGTKGPEQKVVTKNISPCGVQALMNKEIKKGDWLELNIYIPTLKKPLYSVAKVVWTLDEKAGKIDAGLKFEEIDPEVKNKFLEYLCELMFSELERLKVEHGLI